MLIWSYYVLSYFAAANTCGLQRCNGGSRMSKVLKQVDTFKDVSGCLRMLSMAPGPIGCIGWSPSAAGQAAAAASSAAMCSWHFMTFHDPSMYLWVIRKLQGRVFGCLRSKYLWDLGDIYRYIMIFCTEKSKDIKFYPRSERKLRPQLHCHFMLLIPPGYKIIGTEDDLNRAILNHIILRSGKLI